MTLLNFICCWLRYPNQRNIDEMFESMLFLQDRQEILEEMSRYNHTPATISKLRRPSDQCPLLLVACIAGDPILVDLLLEEGGGGDAGVEGDDDNKNDMLSSEWDDIDGNSPLLCACLGGHISVVDVLLDSKEASKSLADLLTRPNNEGTTPIIAAAWRGHLEIVQKLSKMPGVTLTTRDSLKRSAKDLAAEWGHKKVVEWIDKSLLQLAGEEQPQKLQQLPSSLAADQQQKAGASPNSTITMTSIGSGSSGGAKDVIITTTTPNNKPKSSSSISPEMVADDHA